MLSILEPSKFCVGKYCMIVGASGILYLPCIVPLFAKVRDSVRRKLERGQCRYGRLRAGLASRATTIHRILVLVVLQAEPLQSIIFLFW